MEQWLYISYAIVVCFECFHLILHITYFLVMFMYSYCYVCSVLATVFHCVTLCTSTVCV